MASGSYSIRLDSVQIGVADLDDAERAYTTLLGGNPTLMVGGSRRYQLAVGAVELVAGESGLRSIGFACEHEPPYHGESVPVRFSREVRNRPAALGGGFQAIDHIVVQSTNLDRALRIWRDQLGLRLALDRSFAERGMRILFFRSGGITLEVAGPPTAVDDGQADQLYGITYRVDSVEAQCARLARAGVEVSSVRRGHKQGTTVATVRSGTVGIPTLLLEDPSRIVPS